MEEPFVKVTESVALTLAAKPKELSVYIMLLLYRNRSTGQCNPSITTLMQRCKQSRRVVIRSIQGLEEKGLLAVVRREGMPNQYNFTSVRNGTGVVSEPAPVGGSNQYPFGREPVSVSTPTSIRLGANQCQNGHPNQSIEPERTRSEPEKDSGFGFEDWWKAYPVKKGSKLKARKSFAKAMRELKTSRGMGEREATQFLIDQSREYVQTQKQAGLNVAYPTTWLNDERWNDEPTPTNAISRRRNGFGSDGTLNGESLQEFMQEATRNGRH